MFLQLGPKMAKTSDSKYRAPYIQPYLQTFQFRRQKKILKINLFFFPVTVKSAMPRLHMFGNIYIKKQVYLHIAATHSFIANAL